MWISLVLGAGLFCGGCRLGMYEDRGTGAGFPPHWGKRLQVRGAARTYQVDPYLYRGGSPSAEGMVNLRALGVRTVISLRSFHDYSGRARRAGLNYVRIPLNAWEGRIDDEMIRFLQVVSDRRQGPFYVHCKRGGDRVGAMVAIYRICVCGWSKQEALREMQAEDFGFLPFWKNLVRYVREADVDKLCAAAGIPPPPSLTTTPNGPEGPEKFGGGGGTARYMVSLETWTRPVPSGGARRHLVMALSLRSPCLCGWKSNP